MRGRVAPATAGGAPALHAEFAAMDSVVMTIGTLTATTDGDMMRQRLWGCSVFQG